MQRIANLIVKKDNKVLLLKKPRRGWYVAPGGKIESGESIYIAANREFREETGTIPLNPHLKGIYTMVIKNDQDIVNEWMLFTFVAEGLEGTPYEDTVEGVLEWHPIESLHHLPMAEGDRTNLLFAVCEKGMQYGTFTYTEDFELLNETIQISTEGDGVDA
ncbi:NUDIX domain-containing protein [Viridibacillus sp. NPDC096237]|uniref:NUDIX domain-containing protein n=1 Tax=Viridibacillus sp. NPDC096237 TaxID=3390721 RepID=UPI003CFC34EF